MSTRPPSAATEIRTARHGGGAPTFGLAVAAADAAPVLGSVTSHDGTTIGYRRFGKGPGLVLVHGSMSSGAHHVELARLLSDTFTVFVPDRRGRGLSGPYRTGDELQQELEDVAALLDATGATNLWGLSSGACIALHAALTMPAIQKVAIFEPPLLPDRARAAAFLREFDDEMARGKLEAAMITAMRGADMGPALFRALPKRLTARLVAMGMAQEAKQPAGPYPTMRALAPTLHSDFAIVSESSGQLDDYRSIPPEVLLMGGSNSPTFLKRALDDLASVLPNARRVELAGLDHAASWNVDRGGHPGPVAEELRRFFG
jgi:pimeloyl-ACP methyl ester carboxylesterase